MEWRQGRRLPGWEGLHFGVGGEGLAEMEGAVGMQPNEGSTLSIFVRSVRETGAVALVLEPLDARLDGVESELRALDGRARLALGGEAPALQMDAAIWAARLMYRLCQCAVCRDLGEVTIRAACDPPCPGPVGPSRVWSVDLLLRHLPALWRWVRRQSHLDPLVVALETVGKTWPMSSVGMPACGGGSIGEFEADPTLLRLYVDRIEAEGDLTRLGVAAVDRMVRNDLGVHRALAPRLADRVLGSAAGVV